MTLRRARPFFAGKGVAPAVDYSTFEVLYSFARKLNPSYAGAAFRISRASDGEPADIGFSGSDVDTDAISTFCAGTTGRVETVYNQGTLGSIYDATKAGANFAIVFESGSLILEGGKLGAKASDSGGSSYRATMSDTDNIFDNESLQYSLVFKRRSSGTNSIVIVREIDVSDVTMRFDIFDDLRSSTVSTPISNQTIKGGSSTLVHGEAQTLSERLIDSTDYYVQDSDTRGTGFKNAVEFDDGSQNRNWTTTNNRNFEFLTQGGDCVIQELVARIKPSTDKDLEGITAIANEQNDYYGIYTP